MSLSARNPALKLDNPGYLRVASGELAAESSRQTGGPHASMEGEPIMFTKIMVPVDLAHEETLGRALEVSAQLARSFEVPVAYVGVSAGTPGALGHNPEEFGAKLEAFAAAQADAEGIEAEAAPVISHDPTADLDRALLDAVETTGADLVVMASHVPGLKDYVWPPHGGKLAAHSKASVFVGRPA